MFTDLWNETASDKYCPNSILKRPINSQEDCQSLCEAKGELECVGISYSHKIRKTDYCYLCRDDTLDSVNREFGFYRRPGTFKICLLWLITEPLLD